MISRLPPEPDGVGKMRKNTPYLRHGTIRDFTVMARTAGKAAKAAKKTRKNIQRSNSTKVSALNMLKSGVSPGDVSKDLQIPARTLRDWKKDAKEAGTWDGAGDSGLARPAPRKSDPGSGGHNIKVTEAVQAKMKKKIEKDPFLTPCGLQQVIPELRNVSQRTIRDVISRKLKIPSRKAAKKPFLTEAQKERRLDWAKRHSGWSKAKWAKVLWSDETHIELWRGAQVSLQVRRPSSISRYHPSFVTRTVKHPPKLMIWASFGNGKLGELFFVEPNAKINAKMYKEVLVRHLKRSMKKTGCKIFMQDGAPCHTARTILAWLDESGVPVMDWVGQSCDMNPIENKWGRLKRLVARYPAATNLDELAKNIRKAWRKLARDTEYLQTLTDSMPSRIAAVIEAKGDVTKY